MDWRKRWTDYQADRHINNASDRQKGNHEYLDKDGKDVLTALMEETWTREFSPVRSFLEERLLQFQGTEELLNIEREIEAQQRKLINGNSALEDFRNLCSRWETIVLAGYDFPKTRPLDS